MPRSQYRHEQSRCNTWSQSKTTGETAQSSTAKRFHYLNALTVKACPSRLVLARLGPLRGRHGGYILRGLMIQPILPTIRTRARARQSNRRISYSEMERRRNSSLKRSTQRLIHICTVICGHKQAYKDADVKCANVTDNQWHGLQGLPTGKLHYSTARPKSHGDRTTTPSIARREGSRE